MHNPEIFSLPPLLSLSLSLTSSTHSMDDVVPPPPAAARTTPSLRRRNSFATSLVVPAKLALPTTPHHFSSFPSATAVAAAISTTTSASSSSTSSTQSFAPSDLEFISTIKPTGYTSIRDLLPTLAVVQSPTPSSSTGGQSGYEISIRNRLVKQAAWAYLQPMSTSSESSGRRFIHRLWIDPVVALFRFIARSFDWMLRAVRVRKR